MRMKIFFLLAMSVALAVSCSKDDYSEPDGTASINMMNEDNGRTMLGNSDVYIDDANNFHGTSCSIAELGTKGGLYNADPVLTLINTEVAVEPGGMYQIFRNDAIREFPSGKIALNISADYYNVYVMSEILQDSAVIGAKVKFAGADVPDGGLPQYDTNIGRFQNVGEELTITLPSSDFEYYQQFADDTFVLTKEGNKLIVRATYRSKYDSGVYIRVGSYYTYVCWSLG